MVDKLSQRARVLPWECISPGVEACRNCGTSILLAMPWHIMPFVGEGGGRGGRGVILSCYIYCTNRATLKARSVCCVGGGEAITRSAIAEGCAHDDAASGSYMALAFAMLAGRNTVCPAGGGGGLKGLNCIEIGARSCAWVLRMHRLCRAQRSSGYNRRARIATDILSASTASGLCRCAAPCWGG